AVGRPAAGEPPGGVGRLRADVGFLATGLGDVLREQEGDHLFELVERVRHLTKAIRGSSPGDADAQRAELQALLAGLETHTAEKLERAFTASSQLVHPA